MPKPKNEADLQRVLDGIRRTCELSNIESSFYEEVIRRILNEELPDVSLYLNWKPSITFRDTIPLADDTSLNITITSSRSYLANF